MSTKVIGIKQLYTDLKTITKETAKGVSFLVVKNSKPTFKIVPLDDYSQSQQFTIDDLAEIQFEGGDKNMSKDIDRCIY